MQAMGELVVFIAGRVSSKKRNELKRKERSREDLVECRIEICGERYKSCNDFIYLNILHIFRPIYTNMTRLGSRK